MKDWMSSTKAKADDGRLSMKIKAQVPLADRMACT